MPIAPSARVRHYLDKLGKSSKPQRLPACNDLADELGVSPGTVKNVYRALAAEGLVRSQVGVGSFWVGNTEAAPRSEAPLRIGVTVSSTAPESRWQGNDGWGGRIFGGVLQSHLAHGQRVQLEACGHLLPDGTLEKAHTTDHLDGLIIFDLKPIPPRLTDSGGRLIPHSRLNPNGTLEQANYVSPDYYYSARTLGAAWRVARRRRALFLSATELLRSPSSQLRYSGLACGLAEEPGVRLRSVNCHGGTEAAAFAAVNHLLEGGWVPDAVFTAGIHLAKGAIMALQQAGISIPRDASVVSGSPATISSGPMTITATAHPLEKVGREMFEMVLRRIASGGADEPARILPVPFAIGASTSADENATLSAHSIL